MLFNKVALFAAAASFAGFALGQNAPEGGKKVHVVQVSDTEGKLKFYPEELDAQVGESVQFHFYPKNHSVAQSSFNEPCVPISEDKSANGTQGFFSGFMPVAAESEIMPVFTVTIDSDAPIWYYCATGRHCPGGMVGVINPPKTNPDRTLAKYREAAVGSTVKIPTVEQGGEDGTVTNKPSITIPTNTAPSTGAPTSDNAGTSLRTSAISVALGAIAAAFFLA